MKKIVSSLCSFYLVYRLYISVFIFFWVIFIISNSGFDTSEGGYHYQVAVQIIKEGRLSFDTLPDGVFQVAPNGKFYAGHEIGNTLFLLPIAFINSLVEKIASHFIGQEGIYRIQQFLLSFQSGIYSSITATLFFTILKVGFSQTVISSFVGTLCLVFTTYFWTYSRNLFDGVLCGTLLTASFLLILQYRKKNYLSYLICSFVCLGFGFITRISMILAIFTSFVYLLMIYRSSFSNKLREISLALITLIPFFLWQSWYNYLRTGIFYKSPVQTSVYAANNSLDGNLFVGISGLLFSPGKSLFIYAPLLILSVILYKKFYHQWKKEALYVLILSILWLLLHSKLKSWYGAWGWGPRHLITILPVLFFPFATNITYVWGNVKLRFLAIILGLYGFLLSLSSIISNWHFRIAYAFQNKLLGDDLFVWSLWQNQSIDMLKAAFSNILRLFIRQPPDIVKGASNINNYTSNTLNIWLNTFWFLGMPWYVVFFFATSFLLLIYWSAKNILSSDTEV